MKMKYIYVLLFVIIFVLGCDNVRDNKVTSVASEIATPSGVDIIEHLFDDDKINLAKPMEPKYSSVEDNADTTTVYKNDDVRQ